VVSLGVERLDHAEAVQEVVDSVVEPAPLGVDAHAHDARSARQRHDGRDEQGRRDRDEQRQAGVQGEQHDQDPREQQGVAGAGQEASGHQVQDLVARGKGAVHP
jgi:hypothetical protein